jgi:hypothetical protein
MRMRENKLKCSTSVKSNNANFFSNIISTIKQKFTDSDSNNNESLISSIKEKNVDNNNVFSVLLSNKNVDGSFSLNELCYILLAHQIMN